MNIIMKSEHEDRFTDGINALINLSDEDFEKVVEELTCDPNRRLEDIHFNYLYDGHAVQGRPIQLGLERKWDSEYRHIGRMYYIMDSHTTFDVLQQLAKMQKEYAKDSKEYNRIARLLKTRDMDAFKSLYLSRDRKIVEKAFKIFEDEDAYERFLDYENNTDYFAIDGKPVPFADYVKFLEYSLGSPNCSLKKDFYVPNIDEYIEKYNKLYDEINFDRFLNPAYEFDENEIYKIRRTSSKTIRRGDEPDWTIDSQLQDTVLKDMPKDFTLEEKAMYIYCKLCKELVYDDGYVFRKNLPGSNYTSEFSKEKLEAIKPGSKVTCWDFSRIYAKMVNNLSEDIQAVAIAGGTNAGHMIAGFYTKNVSVMIDAIDAGRIKKNDLMSAKQGLNLEGIEIISDRKGIIDDALYKVYPLVINQKPKSIDSLLDELREKSKQDVPMDIKSRLESFAEIMKREGLSENEATQSFKFYCDAGYFGDDFESTYIGKRYDESGKSTYKRLILMRSKNDFKQNIEKAKLYFLDTSTMEVSVSTATEVADKFGKRELVYQPNAQYLEGVGFQYYEGFE